jgi:hypothetical protein
MGMTKSKENDLEAKDFHVLFIKHKAKWKAVAQKAHDYAKENMTAGSEPRDDDTSEALLPILSADSEFKSHQRKNRATAKKYREMFADYIVDQVKTK